MKAFAFAAAAIATIANLPTAFGWWDNGHMMVGEVATQLMDPADVITIKNVLSEWEKDFPNTSTITTAAIWADQVKCKSVAPYCASPLTPSFSMMDDWHYVDLPLNVNGAKWKNVDASLALFADSLGGLSITFMENAMTTLASTNSTWATNLVLRQFIHIFGDSHQPLHAVAGVSPGLPGGDGGGNSYKFASPCGFTNLHALWDAAGGEYSTNNWAPDNTATMPALEANATELISWLPSISDSLDFDQYKSLSFADFSTAMVKNSGLRKVILDSYDFATNVVYTGLDLTFTGSYVPCPPKSYVDWAAQVSKYRIAVGGKRLAVVLTQFAKQLRTRGLAK